MIYFQRGINANFISFFLICPVWQQFEDKFFWQLFSEIDFESPNTRLSTFKGTIDIMFGIEMPEYNFISEENRFAFFLIDYRFELLLLSFGPRQGLDLFGFILQGVHFVIYFERGGGQDLEQRLPVVGDIEFTILIAIGLEVQFWISIPTNQISFTICLLCSCVSCYRLTLSVLFARISNSETTYILYRVIILNWWFSTTPS